MIIFLATTQAPQVKAGGVEVEAGVQDPLQSRGGRWCYTGGQGRGRGAEPSLQTADDRQALLTMTSYFHDTSRTDLSSDWGKHLNYVLTFTIWFPGYFMTSTRTCGSDIFKSHFPFLRCWPWLWGAGPLGGMTDNWRPDTVNLLIPKAAGQHVLHYRGAL